MSRSCPSGKNLNCSKTDDWWRISIFFSDRNVSYILKKILPLNQTISSKPSRWTDPSPDPRGCRMWVLCVTCPSFRTGIHTWVSSAPHLFVLQRGLRAQHCARYRWAQTEWNPGTKNVARPFRCSVCAAAPTPLGVKPEEAVAVTAFRRGGGSDGACGEHVLCESKNTKTIPKHQHKEDTQRNKYTHW